jgi:hypothetical protein
LKTASSTQRAADAWNARERRSQARRFKPSVTLDRGAATPASAGGLRAHYGQGLLAGDGGIFRNIARRAVEQFSVSRPQQFVLALLVAAFSRWSVVCGFPDI